ncbi:MAG: hypothetical protein JWM82_3849 [Myxococcales bacterium]|nr:hypothetical protein [Myxococcales bacterium]
MAIEGRRALRAGLVAALAIVGCHGNIRFDDLTVCAQDPDCILPSLHCDSGTCVACTSDAHCTTAALPRCDLALHRCVECGLTSDCAGGGICKTGHCASPCSAGCPASAPRCDDGACVQCDDGKGCSASSVGPFCVSHMCAVCGADKDCGGATPRCDAVAHRCVQCQLNNDCTSKAPLCDLATGNCVPPP